MSIAFYTSKMTLVHLMRSCKIRYTIHCKGFLQILRMGSPLYRRWGGEWVYTRRTGQIYLWLAKENNVHSLFYYKSWLWWPRSTLELLIICWEVLMSSLPLSYSSPSLFCNVYVTYFICLSPQLDCGLWGDSGPILNPWHRVEDKTFLY